MPTFFDQARNRHVVKADWSAYTSISFVYVPTLTIARAVSWVPRSWQ